MEQTHYLKEYAKYATLNILGMLGLSCYILADTFFIAKGLGANGLAALNLAIPVYSFIHGSALMLGMGGATKYSIFRVQKDKANANRFFTNSFTLALMISLVFVCLGLFFSRTLTTVLGADESIFGMTNLYLKVILLFAPAFVMNEMLLCFVRNDGNPKLAMTAMLGGSFSNIILDYIFIFPMQMGIFGAVFATGLSPIISMLILSQHKLKNQNGFHLIKERPSWRITLATVSLGFPSLIAELSSGIVIIMFNIIILGLRGNVGVAAYGVVANISLVVIAIYTGIAQGTQPLFSNAYGYNDKKNIKKLLRYAMLTVAALSCIIYAVMFFFAGPITQMFNSENNMQLQSIAVDGIKIYFTAVLFVGFNIIISVFFTSTERALPAHIISLLRGLFLIVPMAFLLSALMGLTGVWLAFPVTEAIVAVVGVICFLRKKA